MAVDARNVLDLLLNTQSILENSLSIMFSKDVGVKDSSFTLKSIPKTHRVLGLNKESMSVTP